MTTWGNGKIGIALLAQLFDYSDRIGQIWQFSTPRQERLPMNSDLLQAGELTLTANLALFLAQRQLRLDELAHDVGEATSLGVG